MLKFALHKNCIPKIFNGKINLSYFVNPLNALAVNYVFSPHAEAVCCRPLLLVAKKVGLLFITIQHGFLASQERT